jgi:hypothetical protein
MNRPSLTVPVGTPPNHLNPRHRYRIYTGPTAVLAVAERLAKVCFTTVGTAHVYVATNLGKSVVAKVLSETWTEHDIEELGGMR